MQWTLFKWATMLFPKGKAEPEYALIRRGGMKSLADNSSSVMASAARTADIAKRQTVVAASSGERLEQLPFISGFQQLIDALPEQIGLVDEHWVLIAINQAWSKTAALYGYDALRPGTNYFEFCKERADEGHNAARPAVEGIKQIDAGLCDTCHYLYDGNDRWEGRTFQLTINRLQIEGRTFAIVTRSDVSELVRLRRLREGFAQSMIEGQAEERRRVARDVHDSTLQLLASLGLGLGRLKRTRKSKQTLDIVDELERLLSETLREIRSISFLAHPPILEEVGLREALKALTAGFERRTGLTTSFRIDGTADGIWRPGEAAIYRIIQEALSNIYRHARATKVDVGVFVRRSMAHVVVLDNGIGISPFVHHGVGLPGMRERLVDLGGRLAVKNRSPGTIIIASVPRFPPLRAVGDLALR